MISPSFLPGPVPRVAVGRACICKSTQANPSVDGPWETTGFFCVRASEGEEDMLVTLLPDCGESDCDEMREQRL